MAVGFGCKSVRTNFDTSMRGGVAVILAVSCRQQQEERAITPARERERETGIQHHKQSKMNQKPNFVEIDASYLRQ